MSILTLILIRADPLIQADPLSLPNLKNAKRHGLFKVPGQQIHYQNQYYIIFGEGGETHKIMATTGAKLLCLPLARSESLQRSVAPDPWHWQGAFSKVQEELSWK